jgi:hypothetical protein
MDISDVVYGIALKGVHRGIRNREAEFGISMEFTGEARRIVSPK